jgi:type I restriction enzyme S subunit
MDIWLRWWLKTPQSRRYLSVSSTNSEHVTLPLGALRRLPVTLPPPGRRRRLAHTLTLAERRMVLNSRIAAHATELADALFSRAAQGDGHNGHAVRPLGEVGRVVTGAVCSVPDEGEPSTSWAAPKEVLNSRTVHLERTATRTAVPADAACPPGTLLVAPRPGEVRTVLSTIPVVPGRGTLAIRTDSEADRMWLLHALRSRPKELVATAQGQQARAMGRKNFSRFTIPWPTETVRKDFAERAAALNDLALAVIEENRALEELVIHDVATSPNKDR